MAGLPLRTIEQGAIGLGECLIGEYGLAERGEHAEVQRVGELHAGLGAHVADADLGGLDLFLGPLADQALADLPLHRAAGKVQAVASYAQGAVPGIEIRSKKEATPFMYADCGVTAVSNGIIVHKDMLKDPALIRAFVSATLKGFLYARQESGRGDHHHQEVRPGNTAGDRQARRLVGGRLQANTPVFAPTATLASTFHGWDRSTHADVRPYRTAGAGRCLHSRWRRNAR
ncbi:MAG: ABC transporter substrate-binding protein [Nitrospiraceae bacterium]|nr:ABC transporter substrate-binding protein [Nitrospiraceae bacterium]